jgi:hypothetical protein
MDFAMSDPALLLPTPIITPFRLLAETDYDVFDADRNSGASLLGYCC